MTICRQNRTELLDTKNVAKSSFFAKKLLNRLLEAGQIYALMRDWVFPFIKTLGGDRDSAYSKYMDDGIGAGLTKAK